uniref:Putative lipocalin-6 1 n=1 Tax=Amblyomma triste TaxID=251400 RepID=A0A023GDV3_AMBTT
MVGFALLILCTQIINVFSNKMPALVNHLLHLMKGQMATQQVAYFAKHDIVFATILPGDIAKVTLKLRRCPPFVILAQDRTFRLVFMTVEVNQDAYRCVTTTTIAKDESKHQVTEHVVFTASCLENCISYNRTFQFESETGKYNKMTSIPGEGFRSSTYQFLLAQENCTVVRDISPRSILTEHVRVEQRNTNSADSPQQETGDCMLWVEDKITDPDEECRKRFKTLCGETFHSFKQVNCEIPAPASQAQAKEKTEN